jgi:hypothetical protein
VKVVSKYRRVAAYRTKFQIKRLPSFVLWSWAL